MKIFLLFFLTLFCCISCQKKKASEYKIIDADSLKISGCVGAYTLTGKSISINFIALGNNNYKYDTSYGAIPCCATMKQISKKQIQLIIQSWSYTWSSYTFNLEKISTDSSYSTFNVPTGVVSVGLNTNSKKFHYIEYGGVNNTSFFNEFIGNN
jgi:hypothetical protein